MVECALIQRSNGVHSIPIVQHRCTENILSSYFDCREEVHGTRVSIEYINTILDKSNIKAVI